jgi:hypothetical protein
LFFSFGDGVICKNRGKGTHFEEEEEEEQQQQQQLVSECFMWPMHNIVWISSFVLISLFCVCFDLNGWYL